MEQTYPLTPFPGDVGLASPAKPWMTIYRMLGMVLLLYILSQFVVLIFFGLLDSDLDGLIGPSDPIMAIFGSLCSLPLIALAIYMTRPKLTHVLRSFPHPQGQYNHQIAQGKYLQTPTPTVFQHHLVMKDIPLQIPEAKVLWISFFSGVIICAMALFPLVLGFNAISIVLALIVALPAWIIGFSTPVFAWWGFSSRYLGIVTTQREGEMMLIAGMLSTFPALLINSILFPSMLYEIVGMNPNVDSLLVQNLTIVVSAPVGEELCKLIAILCLWKLIDSPRRGFQIGFTVGLGFAMLENLQYILVNLLTDQYAAFSYSFTAILRGVGSIPGHALWTGMTGYAVGWYAYRTKKTKPFDDIEIEHNVQNWITFDSKTGQQISSAGDGSMPSSWLAKFILGNSNSSRRLPTSITGGVCLAILGHMFWNGSSFVVSFALSGVDEVFQVLGQLIWIANMVVLLWIVGKVILQTAIKSPTK